MSVRSSFVAATLALSLDLAAVNFSFFATLRAGQNAGASWEQGVGSNSSASNVTTDFRWAPGNQHWRAGNLPQNFRIGYDAATGTAYSTVTGANSTSTISFANPAGLLGANATWTLPAASFFVSAAAKSIATSINLDNLTLSSGVQILGGSLPVSLAATQPGGGPAQSQSMTSPLIFNAAASGGDWFIAGTVRFSGLTSNGTGAQDSDLQFLMNANGTDTPEPASFALIGLGVTAVWLRAKCARLRY